MSRSDRKSHNDFKLPPSVVTKVDITHLLNDAERVDNELTTATVRAKAGADSSEAPRFSDQLLDFLSINELSFDDTNERSQLIQSLRNLKDKAPVVHMTFASTADIESLQQIVKWMRDTVHPQAVISVGLQPSLIAGVYVRTPNRVHDFSLRARLVSQRDLLRKELEATRG